MFLQPVTPWMRLFFTIATRAVHRRYPPASNSLYWLPTLWGPANRTEQCAMIVQDCAFYVSLRFFGALHRGWHWPRSLSKYSSSTTPTFVCRAFSLYHRLWRNRLRRVLDLDLSTGSLKFNTGGMLNRTQPGPPALWRSFHWFSTSALPARSTAWPQWQMPRPAWLSTSPQFSHQIVEAQVSSVGAPA